MATEMKAPDSNVVCRGSGLRAVAFRGDDGTFMCAVCPARFVPVDGMIPEHPSPKGRHGEAL